jgi:DNA-binding protein H-NS
MNDAKLASLSVKELRELREQVEQAMITVEQREKTQLLARMAEMAAEYGLSLDEIVGPELEPGKARERTSR